VAGNRTGVSFGYLCLLEHGKRVPSVVVAEALVETYGLTASEAALLRSVALEGVGRSFDPSRYESGTWFGT
jgi:transcriptional regulator with XRE-family HTH domain